MTDDKEVMVICSAPPGYTEGKETACVVCNTPLWLSDSSVADLQQDRIILPHCLKHAIEVLDKETASGKTNHELLPITERQKQEIKKHIDEASS